MSVGRAAVPAVLAQTHPGLIPPGHRSAGTESDV